MHQQIAASMNKKNEDLLFRFRAILTKTGAEILDFIEQNNIIYRVFLRMEEEKSRHEGDRIDHDRIKRLERFLIPRLRTLFETTSMRVPLILSRGVSPMELIKDISRSGFDVFIEAAKFEREQDEKS